MKNGCRLFLQEKKGKRREFATTEHKESQKKKGQNG